MSDGGLSPEKQADPFIQEICDEVKPQAEKMVGRNISVFEAKSYATQEVHRKNYFIKVCIGSDKYDHLRVYQRLPGDGPKFTLEKMVLGETLDEAIIYF